MKFSEKVGELFLGKEIRVYTNNSTDEETYTEGKLQAIEDEYLLLELYSNKVSVLNMRNVNEIIGIVK